MNIYAKISEKANVQFDDDGESLPIYLVLQDPAEGDDEEMKQLINDLTNVAVEFITIITEVEYNENVEIEEPYPFEDEEKGCGGCVGCRGNCH